MKDTDNTFEWNDELVKEFVHRTFAPSDPNHAEVNEFLDKFKQSKLPPLSKDKERIEVSNIADIKRQDGERGIVFTVSKPVFKDKFDEIKQAVEDAINGGVVRVSKSYWKRLHEDFDRYEKLLKEKALNEDTVASYDGVYFKTKQGARLYTKQEVDDMIKEACKEKDNGLSLPDDYIDDMGRLKIQFANGEKKSVEELIKEFNSQPLAFYSPPKRYSQSEVDAIREETWKAARARDVQLDKTWKFQYSSLSDYLQSLTKDKEVDTGKDSKEWEIISVRWVFNNPDLKDFVINKTNGMWRLDLGKECVLTDEQILKNECIKIYSVKRLSDNEVFTIGDKIGWGTDGSYETTLTGFEIVDGRLKIDDSQRPKYCGKSDFLNAYKLHKKPSNPRPQSI